HRTLFFLLAAVFSAVFLLGSRWEMIARTGNPVPYHDQWYAEPPIFFLQTWSEKIAWLFSQHNDHRIIPTRLLSAFLYQANFFWDVRLQMVVNAVIAAAAMFPLLALLRPFLSSALLVLAAGGIAWLASL